MSYANMPKPSNRPLLHPLSGLFHLVQRMDRGMHLLQRPVTGASLPWAPGQFQELHKRGLGRQKEE